MNQLQVEALEDEIEHALEQVEGLRHELREIRENVMVALEELRSLPGAEGATWRLRRCLVKELAHLPR